jgi:hypothetical protein
MARNIILKMFKPTGQDHLTRVGVRYTKQALSIYYNSPQHMIAVLKGREHLRKQVRRVKNKAVRQFISDIIAGTGSFKKSIFTRPITIKFEQQFRRHSFAFITSSPRFYRLTIQSLAEFYPLAIGRVTVK